jgi:hypothetical protein
MSTCPLLRASFGPSPTRKAAAPTHVHGNAKAHLWLAVLLGLAGLVGFYQLQQVLNAIPDSNEDFIYF